MDNNLSRSNRQYIIQFLKELSENEKDENNLIAFNEIINTLADKKYGLVWEEHQERVDEELINKIPVFKELKEKEITSGEVNDYNFLLEGDNLHSLSLLNKTHKNRVDVIYIDPVYNTRKDGFTYNDMHVDEKDGYRHSKWLSFMSKRLELAKSLLTSEGVIFISIDENEFAQLKLLMDEIFGEKCFIDCLIWNKRVPKNDKGIGNIHEYILMYSRTPELKKSFMIEKEQIDQINQLVEDAKKQGKSIKEAEQILKNFYKKNKFPRAITLYCNLDNEYRIFGKINMSWPNGNTMGPRYNVIHPVTKKPVKIPDRGWRWKETTLRKKMSEGKLTKLHDGSYILGEVWFAKDENVQSSSIKYLDNTEKMLLSSIISLKSNGSMELEKIFGKKNIFSYPKPTKLIEHLISSVTSENKEAIVLDFFAGSATTGHAVINLNKKDNGNRTFILATNNENGIAENVAYKRLENVVKGYKDEHYLKEVIFRKKLTVTDIRRPTTFNKKVEKVLSENSDEDVTHEIVDGDYIISKRTKIDVNEKAEFNLKYYRTEFIERFSHKEEFYISEEIMQHIKEMIQLENQIHLDNEKYVLVTNDVQLEEFIKSNKINKCKKLFKTSFVFFSTEELGILKNKDIKVITVPEYYFARELKEVGEI